MSERKSNPQSYEEKLKERLAVFGVEIYDKKSDLPSDWANQEPLLTGIPETEFMPSPGTEQFFLDGMQEEYGKDWGVIQEAKSTDFEEAMYAVYVKERLIPIQKTFTDPKYPQRILTVIQGGKDDA